MKNEDIAVVAQMRAWLDEQDKYEHPDNDYWRGVQKERDIIRRYFDTLTSKRWRVVEGTIADVNVDDADCFVGIERVKAPDDWKPGTRVLIITEEKDGD